MASALVERGARAGMTHVGTISSVVVDPQAVMAARLSKEREAERDGRGS
jgi:hypothetical protein